MLLKPRRLSARTIQIRLPVQPKIRLFKPKITADNCDTLFSSC